jgi:hypothetical protein
MTHLAQHIRTRLRDGRVIATTTEERRLAMRTIFHLARDTHLLAVALVDAHLHLLAHCSPAAASALVRRIEASLKQRLALPVGFTMYQHEPVRDARHLSNAFRYVLTQHDHHGLQTDPYRETTNLPDLLGLRLVGRQTRSAVGRWLPRVGREQICDWLGAPRLAPADGPPDRLVEATLSAACLPSLGQSTRPVQQARRAALAVLGQRLPVDEAAALLGIQPRTLFRLKRQPADPALVQAIRLQLGLRQLHGDRAP